MTVKSDDVVGRTRVYESIVKGEHALAPSVPESFNVLVKELQGLGLDVRLERKETVVTGAELFDKLVKRELEQPALAIPTDFGPDDDDDSGDDGGESKPRKESAKAKK